MKTYLSTLFGLLFSLLQPINAQEIEPAEQSQFPLKVMSFNIRYNNPNDGEHTWPNRKNRVASVIRFHGADLIGMQEALRDQIEDLQQLLPEYSWIGVGRDDGVDAGEFSPFFYRRDQFEVIDQGTFWLSETPELPGSRSWDAAITRLANWARLKDLRNNRSFFYLNTHFDHRGEQARTESARLIVSRLQIMAANEPIIVTGDFNVPPSTETYQIMTASLRDSRLLSITPPHGPEGTFSGFTVVPGSSYRRIDYIFVAEGIKVQRYGVISDQWNGNYPSDHLPVLAELLLP
ncbi:MAG: endonuclease/exonuclease/phosphatase family protein [Pseudomonadota bacterium]|nr:endonuclease/exonuclease/phosphatase family protein [Pseudomonadota bacterium]